MAATAIRLDFIPEITKSYEAREVVAKYEKDW
jgi:hypothetical protein